MQAIDDRIVFSRPRLLSASSHSQVVSANFKLQGSSSAPKSCILKFFPVKSQLAYEKEIAVYRWLHNWSRTTKHYARPLGYAQWVATKYVKTIGRGIRSILVDNPDSHIYVLMLKEIENASPMSAVTITPALAVAALNNLAILHETGVVHGDISTDNILVLEEEESVSVFWIDFSSSFTDASAKQTAWEMDRAAEYFSQWAGVQKSSLVMQIKQPSARTSRPKTRPVDVIQPLGILADTIKFYDLVLMSEGTHAEIYRAKEMEFGTPFCIKIFRQGWMTPFNKERSAYEYLQNAKVTKYIPQVYGYGYRTRSAWGLQGFDDDEEMYYAIVMDWLEGMEQLSAENITHDHACELLQGLSLIHGAGVLHADLYRRNMMIRPKTNEVVWIDFSCSHVKEYSVLPQEMSFAQGIILELLQENGKRQGARQMVRAYALYSSVLRRTLGISFSMLLTIEGTAWFLGRELLRARGGNVAIVLDSTVGYGPLKIFAAAVLASDSSAIHMRDTVFRVAWTVKFAYLLFIVAVTSAQLISDGVRDARHTWLAVRLCLTIPWVVASADELLWWKEEPLAALPGLNVDGSVPSDSDQESDGDI